MTTKTLDDLSGSDTFDICDLIDRVEALEVLRQPGPVDTGNPEDADCAQDDLFAELATLEAFLERVKGAGGHRWRGARYPILFIRDSFLTEYAQQSVGEIEAEMPHSLPTYVVIDWEATAKNIRQDYESVDFNGDLYWCRY